MKNTSFIITAFSIIVLLHGCSMFCEKGSGNVIRKEFDVTAFSELDIQDIGTVYISQGDNCSMTIETDDNIMEMVEAKVKGDELKISTGSCVENLTKFDIYITLRELKELEISGSVEVFGKTMIETGKLEILADGSGDIILDIDAEELETEISGSGKVRLKGKADSHELEIKESGSFDGLYLITNHADIDVNGSGDCMTHVNKTLKAEVKGSGDLKYSGNPQETDTKISGTGSISVIK